MEKHTEVRRMEKEVLQRSAAASRPKAETSQANAPQAEIAPQTEAAAPRSKAETSQTEENAPQEEAPVPDFLAENPLGKREADISGEARGVPVK